MTQVGQVSVGLGLDDKEFNKKIKQAEKSTLNFAKGMKTALGALGLGLSAKVVVDYVNTSVQAFRTQQKAVEQLNTTLANSGIYSQQYSKHLQDLASSLQKVTNYGDEVTLKAIAQGQAYLGNLKITDELVKATMDYASATETDLNSAFTLVGKSIGTSTNALRRYGVVLDDNMTKEEKMARVTEVLSQRYKGSAEAMSDASVQLKNALGDLSEEIGGVFNPIVEASQKIVTQWANSLTTALNKMRKANQEHNVAVLKDSIKYQEEQLKRAKGADKQLWEERIARNKKYLGIQEKELEKINGGTKKENQTPQIFGDTKKSGSKSTKADEALENYKAFIAEFKQATNEYNATLKARKDVEKLYGESDISWLQDNKEGLINAFKAYNLKITEIEQTNTYKRNELKKLANEELQRELQELDLQYAQETGEKTLEILKKYQDKQKEILLNEEAYQNVGGFLASFGTTFNERLKIEQDYLKQREELINTHFNTIQEKMEAFNQLELTKTQELAQLDVDVWRQRGHEVQSILESSLSTMLTNYGDFSDNLKQLVLNLTNYVIKEMLQMAVTSQTTRALLMGVKSWWSGLFKGGLAMAGSIAHSGHTFLAKHHYGGMEVPDQTEHFALLKDNERVLSPSETSAYNQNESNTPNYVVYAPQVRAMDSKDVAQWFNDNKNQILGIVSQGIKDNNQGLRTQIQGV